MKYLVTGFQAFGGDELNPTEVLLEIIRGDKGLAEIFETQLLPVEYQRAHQIILDRPDLDSFDGIFSFGLAGGRSKISLERIALNWFESSQPDNAGYIPTLGKIDPDSDTAFINSMNLEALKNHFNDNGLPSEISLSAGGYVCNYLYFQLMKLKKPILFIHVPFLQEQVANKQPGTPYITRDQILNLALSLAMFVKIQPQYQKIMKQKKS